MASDKYDAAEQQRYRDNMQRKLENLETRIKNLEFNE